MTYEKGSVGDFMRWTMTIAKDPSLAGSRARRWFDSDATAAAAQSRQASAESIVKLLSDDNLKLLKLIGSREFSSLGELASTVDRAESNLSRTLKKLAEAGIIELASSGRALRPRLIAKRVTLDLDLIGPDTKVSVVHTT